MKRALKTTILLSIFLFATKTYAVGLPWHESGGATYLDSCTGSGSIHENWLNTDYDLIHDGGNVLNLTSDCSNASPWWADTATRDAYFSGREGGTYPNAPYIYELQNFSAPNSGGDNLGSWYFYWTGTSTLVSTIEPFTRIITTTPNSGATEATSTLFEIGATGYVTEEDFIFNNTKLKISVYNSASRNNNLVGPASALTLGVFREYEYTIPLEATIFSYSSTSDYLNIGQHDVVTKIVVPWASIFGFDIGEKVLYSTSTSFLVATSTEWDVARRKIIGVANAFSQEDSSDYCEGIFTSLSLPKLFTCMFFLDQGQLTDLATNYHDNVFARVPFGYVTRIYDIFTDTATTALPTLSYTFSSSFPAPFLAGQTLAFNPWQYMYTDGSLVKDVWKSDIAGEEKNVWEIVGPLVDWFVYLMLALLIFHDITGIAPGFGEEGTGLFGKRQKKNPTTDEYAYKEKLYELSQKK